MSITVNLVKNMNEIYRHYSTQSNSQGTYIEIDCKNGYLSASYNAMIGNAVPFSVYHGHDQRFAIPTMTVEATNDLLNEIEHLAERVVDGYKSCFDGNNTVARFDDDATEALEEIEQICDDLSDDDSNEIQEWDVGDWVSAVPKPSAECSDEDFDKMVSEYEPDEDNVIINGDIEEYLNEIRYEKRCEAIEEKLDDIDTVVHYIKYSCSDENPVYAVEFENGREASVEFDSNGKMTWKRVN